MALNLNTFLLILLAATIAAILTLEPYHMQIVTKKGVPQVAFERFVGYEIDARRIESRLEGRAARRFGAQTIVDRPKLVRIAKRGEESVQALKGIFVEGRRITLQKDVRLARSDGWRLSTDRLVYEIPVERYTTAGHPFVILYGRSIVKGKNLKYDRKSGKIWAEKIHAKIAEEDRE